MTVYYPTSDQVLRSKFGGLIWNVAELGADPTGVKDSTGAIQQAIDYCVAAGGGIVYLAAGSRYLVSKTISITGENVHLCGPGWAFPLVGGSNPVSRGTPLATITPSAAFPSGSPVIDFNNTSYMINGCSVENLSIDSHYLAGAVPNVPAIHFGNAAFFRIANVILIHPTGSGILIDEAGATYASPSTSQIYIENVNIFDGDSNGIEFAANLFMTEVFIHDSYIWGLSGTGIKLGQSDGAFDIHVHNNAIGGCVAGIYCGTFETFIHDNDIYGTWGNGIEFASTAAYGYMSKIHDNIIRDADKYVNGSAGIMVDTGSYSLIISDNICEKVNNTPEYGIVVVDGANDTAHNIYLDDSNFCVGNSIANYKSAAYEVTATRFNNGPQTAPAIPASGTALTNPFPFDCTVYVAGGTVTAIDVGGTATGMTSGPIAVAAGQTITLTYSAAPTWAWFGN